MKKELSFEFLDLEKVDPNIVMDVRYAREDNFVKKIVYPLAKCFLRKKVALKLAKIQKKLEKRGLGLKVFDGYRPLSVQKIFWEILPDDRYVADPSIGSKHNRGAAVDVTIVNEKGEELEMPTDFDSFSEKAHWTCMDLKPHVIENRALLGEMMASEGFMRLETEWWHYDDADWKEYPVEDISLEELSKSCSDLDFV